MDTEDRAFLRALLGFVAVLGLLFAVMLLAFTYKSDQFRQTCAEMHGEVLKMYRERDLCVSSDGRILAPTPWRD